MVINHQLDLTIKMTFSKPLNDSIAMSHINFNNDFPGIRAALAYRPETAGPLGQLAQILLKDTTGISPAERELIATYVSYLNDCFYCHVSHGEIACIYMDGNRELVEQVKQNFSQLISRRN